MKPAWFLLLTVPLAAVPDAGAQARQPKRKANILIVSARNVALDAFFDQPMVQQSVQVKRLKPADLEQGDYRQQAVARAGYDLVIFDRCAPKVPNNMPQC